jgi:hypothetical protein
MLRCLMLKTLHFVISPPFRGSIYGWNNMLWAEMSLVQILMRSLDSFNMSNCSSLTIAFRFNRPPTEMSTVNIPRGSRVNTRCERLTSPPFVSRLSKYCYK